jgi:dihydrofolate reductase
MAKLIYSMLTSLDGFIEDADGRFGWAAPSDEVHAFVNDLASSVGTYLYGRKMYDVMAFWETASEAQGLGAVELDWARQWRAAQKVVYSRTLAAPRSERTRIERAFDADAVRRLVAASELDVAVAGPELAAHAIAAGLVDEFHLIASPVVVGGGKRFFPPGVRIDLRLVDERAFDDGFVALRYAAHR